MKLAIVGSRTFTDYNKLCKCIDFLNTHNNIDTIISGGARGADTLAKQYAESHNITLLEYKADWDTYGKSAGFIRNKDIIKNSDFVVAFWDGQSRGTKNDIDLCHEYHKSYIVVFI